MKEGIKLSLCLFLEFGPDFTHPGPPSVLTHLYSYKYSQQEVGWDSNQGLAPNLLFLVHHTSSIILDFWQLSRGNSICCCSYPGTAHSLAEASQPGVCDGQGCGQARLSRWKRFIDPSPKLSLMSQVYELYPFKE